MEIGHLDKQTPDGVVRNFDALYQLFPSCFTETPLLLLPKLQFFLLLLMHPPIHRHCVRF